MAAVVVTAQTRERSAGGPTTTIPSLLSDHCGHCCLFAGRSIVARPCLKQSLHHGRTFSVNRASCHIETEPADQTDRVSVVEVGRDLNPLSSTGGRSICHRAIETFLSSEMLKSSKMNQIRSAETVWGENRPLVRAKNVGEYEGIARWLNMGPSCWRYFERQLARVHIHIFWLRGTISVFLLVYMSAQPSPSLPPSLSLSLSLSLARPLSPTLTHTFTHMHIRARSHVQTYTHLPAQKQ